MIDFVIFFWSDMKLRSSSGKIYCLNNSEIAFSELFTHLMAFTETPFEIFEQNINTECPAIVKTFFPATFQEFSDSKASIKRQLEFWCDTKTALCTDFESKAYLDAFDTIVEPSIPIKCVSVNGLKLAVQFIKSVVSANLSTDSFDALPSVFRSRSRVPLHLILENTPFKALIPLLKKTKEEVLCALRSACVLKIKAMTIFYSCILSQILAGLKVQELQAFLKVPPQYKQSVAQKLDGLPALHHWVQGL